VTSHPPGDAQAMRPLVWVGHSLDDLRALPIDVRRSFGYTLHALQLHAQPVGDITRFVGVANVFEVRKSLGDTYRLVYLAGHAGVIYVLHVFKKKSHKGAATPREDLNLIKARLQDARILESMSPHP